MFFSLVKFTYTFFSNIIQIEFPLGVELKTFRKLKRSGATGAKAHWLNPIESQFRTTDKLKRGDLTIDVVIWQVYMYR